MRRSHKLALLPIIAGLLSIAGLAAGPCVEHRELENGLGHFRVTVTHINGVPVVASTSDEPYDYPDDEVVLRFNATAYDRRGRIMDGQDGRLLFEDRATVLVFPGPHSGFPAPEDRPPTIQFDEGRVEGAEIPARNLYGRATVQVIDMHFDEAEPAQGELWKFTQEAIRGSYALGSSQDIYFDNPSLHDIQINDWVKDNRNNFYSALDHCFVEIDCRKDDQAAGLPDDGHGKLVVTGIFNEGFYVTDAAGTDDGYNHLYVYNYSYPENLEVGDRLDRLVGTAANFSGGTQISFPAWERAMDEHCVQCWVDTDCPGSQVCRCECELDGLIPPALLTSAMCDEDNTGSRRYMCGYSEQNWTMEDLESARVRIEDVKTPDLFVNCDYNADGEIGYSGDEADCRDACLAHDGETVTTKELIGDPEVLRHMVCPWEESIEGIQANCVEFRVPSSYICSELSGLRQWGQWVVALDGGNGPLISLVTRESVVDFDPTEQDNLGMVIEFLQGNLKHTRAARPRWILMVGLGEADSPEIMRPQN